MRVQQVAKALRFDVFLIGAIGVVLSPVRAQTKLVKIDGSSTVYPATEAVAEEFQKEKKGAVNVTVGISGTGGGFKKCCRGEADISDASRPILKEEMELCKQNGIEYIELPVCFDALTVADLKKMWEPEAQGKITHWNQIRPEWPKEKLLHESPARRLGKGLARPRGSVHGECAQGHL